MEGAVIYVASILITTVLVAFIAALFVWHDRQLVDKDLNRFMGEW